MKQIFKAHHFFFFFQGIIKPETFPIEVIILFHYFILKVPSQFQALCIHNLINNFQQINNQRIKEVSSEYLFLIHELGQISTDRT